MEQGENINLNTFRGKKINGDKVVKGLGWIEPIIHVRGCEQGLTSAINAVTESKEKIISPNMCLLRGKIFKIQCMEVIGLREFERKKSTW